MTATHGRPEPDGTGALLGIRVLELGGIGPVPFAGMVLADLGADVIRIDRPGAGPDPGSWLRRGRRAMALDLRGERGRDVARDLVRRADVLLEGFRPGVSERLGLGPEPCLADNPRLVYARVTGWGQDGPLAQDAGHDITYLAVSGALWGLRRAGGVPTPPVNLLGDFGGGALPAVVGVLAALVERDRSGRGQVIDAAIVDGAALFTTFLSSLRSAGAWSAPPGHNLLDTGAPFYDVYACADGGFVAIGALEDRFYSVLLEGTGALDLLPSEQSALLQPERRHDSATWPAAKVAWAAVFATRERDDWARRFAGTDACLAPVLSPDEAADHPHGRARGWRRHAGAPLPPTAPGLGRTPLSAGEVPAFGAHTDAVLRELGYDDERITSLHRDGVVTGPDHDLA